jgi:hypothetical protein
LQFVRKEEIGELTLCVCPLPVVVLLAI